MICARIIGNRLTEKSVRARTHETRSTEKTKVAEKKRWGEERGKARRTSLAPRDDRSFRHYGTTLAGGTTNGKTPSATSASRHYPSSSCSSVIRRPLPRSSPVAARPLNSLSLHADAHRREAFLHHFHTSLPPLRWHKYEGRRPPASNRKFKNPRWGDWSGSRLGGVNLQPEEPENNVRVARTKNKPTRCWDSWGIGRTKFLLETLYRHRYSHTRIYIHPYDRTYAHIHYIYEHFQETELAGTKIDERIFRIYETHTHACVKPTGTKIDEMSPWLMIGVACQIWKPSLLYLLSLSYFTIAFKLLYEVILHMFSKPLRYLLLAHCCHLYYKLYMIYLESI